MKKAKLLTAGSSKHNSPNHLQLAALFMLVISLQSCDLLSLKKRDKLAIDEFITMSGYFYIDQFKLKGLKTNHILMGGSAFYNLMPDHIYGGESMYLLGGYTYKNEFYFVTKELKASILLPTNSAYLGVTNTPFVKGNRVTFAWNTQQYYEGWYSYFVANGIVDPIKTGDTIHVMRIVENKGSKAFDYSDTRAKVSIIKYDSATQTFQKIKEEEQPSFTIEAGEKVGVCEFFTYSGNTVYNINYAIIRDDKIVVESELSSNNLGN